MTDALKADLAKIKEDIIWLTFLVEKLQRSVDRLHAQSSPIPAGAYEPQWVEPAPTPPNFTRIDL